MNPHTKDYILEEIRRTAQENAGAPLGLDRFCSETGIKISEWRGRYWVKWSDAIREAGFAPNERQVKILSDEQLLEKIALLIRELGRHPSVAEINFKHARDPGFPRSETIFKRLGSRSSLITRLVKYFSGRNGYEDIVEILQPLQAQLTESYPTTPQGEQEGFVYLLKSGRYYKIGRTAALARREYELSIQLPEKATLIHRFRTNNPVAMETYWHKRFESRQKNSEWFALTPQDVVEFKKFYVIPSKQKLSV